MAKLIAGSCPQLVFQAVLLGGYTPWSTKFSSWEKFPKSQAASIFMSALMIAKLTSEIVAYRREAQEPKTPTKYTALYEWSSILEFKTSTGREYKAPIQQTMKDRMKDMTLQVKESMKATWKTILELILPIIPLVLSSLIFNTGTLVLTIIVTEWYSTIYIGIVLLLNLTISFSAPFSFAGKMEEKLGLSYKFTTREMGLVREIAKVKERKIIRGIFASWANLFLFLRPVENMSYHKILHVSLLHPLRFIVNIVTLIIVCQITWTAQTHNHNHNQHLSLVTTFIIVLAAGIVNMVEFRYFYTHRKISPSKPCESGLPDNDEIAMKERFEDKEEDSFPLQALPIQSADLPLTNGHEPSSCGQYTLTTVRQSKQSVTSMTSRKSVTSTSQLVTVQEGVHLERALAEEKIPLLPIAEGGLSEVEANMGGDGERHMLTHNEEGSDIEKSFFNSPTGEETSVSETTEVTPDGRVITKKVSVKSIKKISINGKDVDLDNLDDPNSNLTDEEKRQIKLAFQEQGMMAIAE